MRSALGASALGVQRLHGLVGVRWEDPLDRCWGEGGAAEVGRGHAAESHPDIVLERSACLPRQPLLTAARTGPGLVLPRASCALHEATRTPPATRGLTGPRSLRGMLGLKRTPGPQLPGPFSPQGQRPRIWPCPVRDSYKAAPPCPQECHHVFSARRSPASACVSEDAGKFTLGRTVLRWGLLPPNGVSVPTRTLGVGSFWAAGPAVRLAVTRGLVTW